ncbi:DUF3090 domain-containing protein [Brevibacterium sp.]|uniref:DUF3090 domain-containing protein n=1 Tax=Brevibacterium sp. TaxID=1701 RepID=UPI002811685B|nr:DUF3090 domain-containing protein [Brevibacterium sp.]
MAALYDHPTPDRFVVGTIGLPGERTFLLQAKSESALTTVVVEKEQVEILADRITELLDMVMIKDPAARVPQTALDERIDNAGLNVPIDPEFRVGTMSLGWDTVAHELVVECFELTEEDAQAGTSADPDDDEVEREVLRVVLDAAGAREFARRAEQVVSAGRGDCPFCSLPLEPDGHLCPRANGIARA